MTEEHESADGSPDGMDDVVFRHEYADEYHVEPATGVYGGYQPQNNFKIDFTLDHNEHAERERFYEDPATGEVKNELELDDELIREHRVGVIMSSQDVFTAACWMLAELLPDTTTDDIQKLIAEEYDLSGDEDETA